jgi:hypothetical protein
MAYFLLTDSKLEKFYYPLALSAKASVLLQLAESIVYISVLPTNFQEIDAVSNCGEIVLSRLHAICTLFGEMHFVYFISKALGLGGQVISVGRGTSLNLSQALTLTLLASIVTVVACIFYRRTYGLVRNIWCVALALLQHQQVRTAKAKQNNDDCLIRPSDPTVAIFEKLTMMQVFLSSVSLLQRCVYRPLYPEGMAVYNNARLVLDYAMVLLFYLKVILVQEKANVEVLLQ